MPLDAPRPCPSMPLDAPRCPSTRTHAPRPRSQPKPRVMCTTTQRYVHETQCAIACIAAHEGWAWQQARPPGAEQSSAAWRPVRISSNQLRGWMQQGWTAKQPGSTPAASCLAHLASEPRKRAAPCCTPQKMWHLQRVLPPATSSIKQPASSPHASQPHPEQAESRTA